MQTPSVCRRARNRTGSQLTRCHVRSQLPVERFPYWETCVPAAAPGAVGLGTEQCCSPSPLHFDLQDPTSTKAATLGKNEMPNSGVSEFPEGSQP